MTRKAIIRNIDPQFLHKTVQKTVGEIDGLAPKIMQISAAAIVNVQNEVLLATRPEGKDYAGMWEFPGGKMEASEYPEQTLTREIHEELSMEISVKDMQPFSFSTHFHEETGVYMLMHLFVVKTWQGKIKPTENQKFSWIPLERLHEYIKLMPPIDRPLAEMLYKLRTDYVRQISKEPETI